MLVQLEAVTADLQVGVGWYRRHFFFGAVAGVEMGACSVAIEGGWYRDGCLFCHDLKVAPVPVQLWLRVGDVGAYGNTSKWWFESLGLF